MSISLSQKDPMASGLFSEAGRLSLNYYNIITQANRLKRKPHKTERKYFIIPNYSLPVYSEENAIIHSTNFKFKKLLEEDNNQKDNSSNSVIQENDKEVKKVFQGDNYKYYNLHKDRVRLDKKYGPKKGKNESSYSPGLYLINNNYFYKKNKGIDWKNLTGREEKKNMNYKKDINTDIINNINKKLNTNCFIDMSKQTERKGFPLNNNLRQRFEKKYIPLNAKSEKKKWLNFCRKPLIPISPFSSNTYEIFGYRRTISPNFNKHNKKLKLKKVLLSSKNYWPSNKKQIFRNLSNYQQKPICILNPNYKSIEERIKTMVSYNNQKPIIKKNKINKFKGINLGDLYDASKSYEKIHVNKLGSVPDFEKMTSRPKDDKLPSFMKGIYNGMSNYFVTDKSLILSNYSNKKEYDYGKSKKRRKKQMNDLLKDNVNKSAKDISKNILKKFQNLYINFYKSSKGNKNNDRKIIN